MASSIVHLAITNELAKRVSFSDTSRLKFGAVVVDAGEGGNITGESHLVRFIVLKCQGLHAFSDNLAA